MKMRTENTNGDAEPYRDQADFNVAPPPDLSLIKGVVATNKPAGTTWPMPTTTGLDSRVVQQGSTSAFRVDVKNNDATGRNADVVGLETWDHCQRDPRSAIGNYQYIAPRAGTGGTPVTLDPEYWNCEDGAPSYIKWKLPDSATPETRSISGPVRPSRCCTT